MKQYLVTAYRYGEKENHNYLVGLKTNKSEAFKIALDHEEDRGYKYHCEILEVEDEESKTIRSLQDSIAEFNKKAGLTK